MLKTYQYRLYPSKQQARVLVEHLEACRRLYNCLLCDRVQAWQDRHESVGYLEQKRKIPFLRSDWSPLGEVHSQVLQNVAMRVDLAFKAFFRRCKEGETPGFPRYKSAGRYDSLTYPQQPGFALKGERLRLGKIGLVKLRLSRPLEGTPKTCIVRRSATGKWYASITCDQEAKPLLESTEAVGIDVGLEKFATLSTGEPIANPRFFRKDEWALARAQRKLARCERGTPERAKSRYHVARVHERIRFRRLDFAHQLARKMVERFGFIAVEDLKINGMVHTHRLAKSIHDAAWSQFRQCLSYKAAEAGRTLVAVNPAYTSQDCSQCGHRQRKALSDRVHNCPCCDLSIDRDENAACNILRLGLQSQPVEPARIPCL